MDSVERVPVERVPFNFGAVQCKLSDAKAVIIPVPYDSTASYRTGMRSGPREIIEASRNMELYDLELKRDIIDDAPIFTMDEIVCSKESPQEVVEAVENAVSWVLLEGKFPLMLGGEHSVTLGSLKACKKKYERLSVVQIDAHADMRDSYEGTGYSHACVMRRVRELCPNAVGVGIRSMSKDEAEYIKEKGLEPYIFGPEFDEKEIVSKIENERVYVTFDLDAFDPSIMPAVGTPEPQGISWKQAISLLRKVYEEKEVVGADVVELCPTIGDIASAFTAAKLVYKLVGYKFML
ncbi:MAG: agmatinase [Candidatus Anstonellales archaeon]